MEPKNPSEFPRDSHAKDFAKGLTGTVSLPFLFFSIFFCFPFFRFFFSVFFLRGLFKGGGVTEGGGFHTAVRGTMFVRDGAVTPSPSCKCDITFFAKGRPKSAQQLRDSTVAARRVQSVTVPSSRVSRECRSPGLRSPPFKNARFLSFHFFFPVYFFFFPFSSGFFCFIFRKRKKRGDIVCETPFAKPRRLRNMY